MTKRCSNPEPVHYHPTCGTETHRQLHGKYRTVYHYELPSESGHSSNSNANNNKKA